MALSAVHLSRLGDNYLEPLRAGLEFTGFFSRIARGTSVVLKPNLTFPVFRPGVMTGMDCIEALIIALKDHACDVIVAEGDGGGYNKFKIDEVFRRTGLTDMIFTRPRPRSNRQGITRGRISTSSIPSARPTSRSALRGR